MNNKNKKSIQPRLNAALSTVPVSVYSTPANLMTMHILADEVVVMRGGKKAWLQHASNYLYIPRKTQYRLFFLPEQQMDPGWFDTRFACEPRVNLSSAVLRTA